MTVCELYVTAIRCAVHNIVKYASVSPRHHNIMCFWAHFALDKRLLYNFMGWEVDCTPYQLFLFLLELCNQLQLAKPNRYNFFLLESTRGELNSLNTAIYHVNFLRSLNAVTRPAQQSNTSQCPVTWWLAPRSQSDQKYNVLVCPKRIFVNRAIEATVRTIFPAQSLALRLGNRRHVHDWYAAEKFLRLGFYQAGGGAQGAGMFTERRISSLSSAMGEPFIAQTRHTHMVSGGPST